MDVELREVRDFLAAHPPFDGLPATLLDELPSRLQVRYHRRGEQIISLGQANNTLYILRSGAVDIMDADGALVERGDPGTCFGTSSVRSRTPSAFAITAIEDSLVLAMPGEIFAHLMEHSPVFREFFAHEGPAMRQAVASVRASAGGETILRTRVSDIAKRAPITTTEDASIREAAAIMTEHRVSALLVTRGDPGTERLVGIVTDRDLRSKVVAAGRPIDDPVTSVMTPHPLTIHPDALAFEVLLEMTSKNVHHLPVVVEGRPIGLISSGDLMRLEQANPVFLVGDIGKQKSVEGIVGLARRAPRLVQQMIAQDASADDITRVLSAVSDATTRRIIGLAQAELGPAPAPWCWLSLGSQARAEHSLASDQDHAIIYDNSVTPEQDAWYLALAERVRDGLEQCGYPPCHGDVMATNPTWRTHQHAWARYFSTWINEPSSLALMHASIFFDARPIHGDARLYESLQDMVLATAPNSQRFLGHLAAHAVERQPPLGFFKGFVLEKEGDHRDTLDIKSGGVHAVIEMSRVYALANGVADLSTTSRIRAVGAKGAFSEETTQDLVDAFEFVSHVRLVHQAGQLEKGLPPDNFVSPDELTSFERRHLRDAFTIVRKAQQALAYTYQTHMMS